jgi:LemA protein
MLFWIVLIVIAAAIVYAIIIYNSLVQTGQMTNEAWSGIDVQLKRRAELIPNLVESVKGYASHERELLQRVTELRNAAQALPSADVERRAEIEGALSVAVKRIMALAEAYPDLKASENFLELQRELSKLEDEIQMARRYYNGSVRNLNTLVESFPSNLVAGAFRFEQRKFFELSDASEAAVPQVTLQQPGASR